MKRNRLLICLMSLLLLGLLLLAWGAGLGESPRFSFALSGEPIQVWYRAPGDGYVMLPSYAQLSDLTLEARRPQTIGGNSLAPGDSCEALQWEQPYETAEGSLTFLRSGNLPALFLDTASRSMEHIHQKLGNREGGQLRLYDSGGSLSAQAQVEALKGRGNSFDYREKKPYNLRLAAQTDLLGMGAAENWSLLEEGADPTLVKNKLAYDLAGAMGLPFSPQSQWVDLYLNGQYAGVYLLTERNEVHPQRVNLPEGGFLVSKEQRYNLSDEPYFTTAAGVDLRVRHNSLTQQDMEAVVAQAERAILSPEGRDPVSGLSLAQLLDLDSWVKKYTIEELFGGIDAGVASQFFFYDGQRLYAGPVWDYDETMGVPIWLGEDNWLNLVPEIFYAHRSREIPWYHSLYQNPLFYRQLTAAYRQELSPLIHRWVQEVLPAYAEFVAPAARLNALRWDGSPQVEAQAQQVQAYLLDRVQFLDAAWGQGQTFVEVHVDCTYPEFSCDYATFDYALAPGQSLPELPEIPGYTWCVAETGEIFQPETAIYQEMTLYLQPES